MKKILALGIVFILSGNTFAQQHNYNWKDMKPQQRKEIIQKMNPEERMSLLKEFREKMMITELDITASDQQNFKDLYTEYQEKQNAIKDKFEPNENYDSMSDEEATKQLEQSFQIGQQLLDNRKEYAQKFMKVISPQQLLKLYQTEGKMRTKILDRK